MKRAVVAVPVAMTLAGAAMLALFVTERPGELPTHVVVPIFYNVPLVLAFAVVGAAIVWRRAEHPVGWLLYAVATLAGFSTLTEGYTAWHGPGLDWVLWAWSITNGPSYAALAAALLLFPTGAPPTPRWEVLGRIVAVYAIASTLIHGLAPWPRRDEFDALAVAEQRGWPTHSPIGWSGPGWLASAASGVAPVGILLLVSAVISLVWRWRRSVGDERQQIKWLALAGLVAIGTLLLGVSQQLPGGAPEGRVGSLVGHAIFDLLIMLIPVSIGLGVVRYRLYDIDTLISRTVLFGGLTVFIGATYLAAVVVGGQLVGGWAGSATLLGLAAIATVALAVDSVRVRLQAVADRMVYGARARPYELMAQLDRELAEASAPDDRLIAIAEAAGQAVRARSARVTVSLVGNRSATATWPRADEPVMGRPLAIVDNGETIGEIVVEPTVRRAADRDVLQEIAAIATGTLRNLRLDAEVMALRERIDGQNVEVAASRERLAVAADAERAQLAATVAARVGPDLTALLAAIADVEAGAADLEAGCRQLAGHATRVVTEVRALSRGVLPPVLADHGLVAAIRALLRRIDARPTLSVEPSLTDARFPTAVETTVYLACQELVEVALRQRAGRMSVRLWRDDASLAFAIEHDGLALPASGSGSPRTSQDRMAALGGELRTEPTRLTGTIPITA
jgi:signal transduction histidine kinase